MYFQVLALSLSSLEAANWVLIAGLILALGSFLVERVGKGRRINMKMMSKLKKHA